MKMVDKKLFQKAATFSDAALTFIDDDGYPFSVPVSFEVDAEKQLVRVSKPANLTQLETRNVGIIFNHVTPLEGGGYTDRRYVVFWGRLQGEGGTCVLRPAKGFVWDEKEIPFFQYSEMKNSRARNYLDQLKQKPWLSTPWLVLRTFRLPFVIATILPVALGAAIAYRTGFFDWSLFALTMVGALLIHLGVNTANDYFDARSGADDINTTPTPFSGGSRVIQYGLLPAPVVFSMSTAAYFGGCVIGLYLAFTRGWPILLIGLVGLVVSYGYTAPPLKLVYRGFGEFAVAVGFGPLLVLGSYFVQAQKLSLEAFLASLPVGLLVMLILYVNEVPDRTWDDEASKKTVVARMREEMVTKVYSTSLVAVYAILFLGVVGKVFPVTALAGLLTVPMALKVRRLIRENLGNPYGLMPAMSTNIRLYVYTAALILAGYLVSFFLQLA
jgi:1,4-dihydroxy-2-naphthoate octaprenyltransferase